MSPAQLLPSVTISDVARVIFRTRLSAAMQAEEAAKVTAEHEARALKRRIEDLEVRSNDLWMISAVVPPKRMPLPLGSHPHWRAVLSWQWHDRFVSRVLAVAHADVSGGGTGGTDTDGRGV